MFIFTFNLRKYTTYIIFINTNVYIEILSIGNIQNVDNYKKNVLNTFFMNY